ncbi:MAG: glycosyltransferase family 4 protein [Acidimicrobiia bacterium]
MRVAVVTGVIVPHDAISDAVVRQARLVMDVPGVDEVVVFSQAIGTELPSPGRIVPDGWSLLRDPDFMACDIAVFHWGIHYRLFDAITLLLGSRGPAPIVHFHNCTPEDLVSPQLRESIRASILQLDHVASLGVPFWTHSEFNRLTLLDHGVRPDDVAFVPIPIDLPGGIDVERPTDRVELLTVGRRVPAKGPNVLVAAIAMLDDATRASVHLRIVGSPTFSDPDYADELDRLIVDHDLGGVVDLVDAPTDEELWRLYAGSHVVVSPSFHEGLCVPIIEGYAFGCRAIGTTTGNLPFVVQPPDPCVPPGDPEALRDALARMVLEVRAEAQPRRRHPDLVERYSSRSCARALQRELYRQAARPQPAVT